MRLVEGVADDIAILEAHGRVDSTTAREFGERLLGVINAGHDRLILDLQHIAYVSSAGFRALVLADRATEQRQGKLALCGLSGDVMRLFEIGAFLDLFLICSTQQEAIDKLREL